jgi:DNA-binding XRE family transcriptional regulator
MSDSKQMPESISVESMSVPDIMKWVQRRFEASARICEEAETYFSDMKHHHENIAHLVERLHTLENDKSAVAKEEAAEILSVVGEVLNAMEALRTGNLALSESSLDIDEIEKSMTAKDEGKAGYELFQTDIRRFLEKYNGYKNRLGLRTQQDVAELTGIDRRQISRIESGRCKPQFKTIQKIAAGFGIKVEELISHQ